MNRFHPKLTHDQVRMIRNLWRLKVPGKWIANLYGVSRMTVSAIGLGKIYKGVV